ncbi:MAG: BolA family protein [Nitrospira sp.]|nr:BolA family transcriptional regulator [Candidatus Manganitrophaceae bacterium]HIL34901.1 BolA family transcriptional regulator [Candidatus Manganitrophaceae bacterium]
MNDRSLKTKEIIERKMKESLEAVYVEVIDESWKHAGHAAATGGGYYILRVASKKFEGVSLVNRNRMVFDILKEEMKEDIHGFIIKAMTPEEFKSA